MNAVKKNVDEVEESVATAERELGSHTIQKVLSSIPGLRQVSLVTGITNKYYILRKLFFNNDLKVWKCQTVLVCFVLKSAQ